MTFNHAIKMFISQDFNQFGTTIHCKTKQNEKKQQNPQKSVFSCNFVIHAFIRSFTHCFQPELVHHLCESLCREPHGFTSIILVSSRRDFQGAPQTHRGQRCSEITGRLLYVGGNGLGEICAVVMGENPAFLLSCSGGLWTHAGPRLGRLVSG